MALCVTTKTVVSYTAFSPLPAGRGPVGGIFLLHWPGSHLHRTLSGILPCEARTFLSPEYSGPRSPALLIHKNIVFRTFFVKSSGNNARLACESCTPRTKGPSLVTLACESCTPRTKGPSPCICKTRLRVLHAANKRTVPLYLSPCYTGKIPPPTNSLQRELPGTGVGSMPTK